MVGNEGRDMIPPWPMASGDRIDLYRIQEAPALVLTTFHILLGNHRPPRHGLAEPVLKLAG